MKNKYNEEELRELVENNLLLKVKSGSHLYGLLTPESDEDYLGVYLEPLEFLFSPFRNVEELDKSVKDKLENGRNSKDAVDEKYYSLTKYVKLLYSNNPTVVELLFAPEQMEVDPFMKVLLDNRDLFLCNERSSGAFWNYALEQEKKLETKSDNMKKAENVWKKVKGRPVTTESLKSVVEKYNLKNFVYDSEKDYYFVGTRSYPANMTFKRFYGQLKDLVENKSSRAELVDEYGYDLKFMTHYLRLLHQGYELLTTGYMTFPLEENMREFLLKVKTGKVTFNEAMNKGNELKEKFNSLTKEDMVLGDTQDMEKMEELLADFYKEKYLS